MLRKYHQILWSRELPCGEKMELTDEKSHGYLSLLTLTPERLQKLKVRRAKRRRCRRRSIPLKKEKLSSCVGWAQDKGFIERMIRRDFTSLKFHSL